MARFEATVDIDRPVAEVSAFLTDGENDRKFSPRVQAISKQPAGPTAVGTVFRSTVKDAGMTTRREFRISDLVAPARIRWNEVSTNLVTAREGGYHLEPLANGRTADQGRGGGLLIMGPSGRRRCTVRRHRAA